MIWRVKSVMSGMKNHKFLINLIFPEYGVVVNFLPFVLTHKY